MFSQQIDLQEGSCVGCLGVIDGPDPGPRGNERNGIPLNRGVRQGDDVSDVSMEGNLEGRESGGICPF